MCKHFNIRRAFVCLGVALVPILTASCLNPAFVEQSTGNLYPAAPGDEPFLLVRIINDTQATLDVPVVYDDGTGAIPFLFQDISPAVREVGVLLDWPITRVNVGNLDSPFATTIEASLPDGTNVLIPPGQFPAQAGVDFNRGDALIYHFRAPSTNPAAIVVSVSRIDGATQQGPFTRADTFRTVRQLLQFETLSGGITIGTGQ